MAQDLVIYICNSFFPFGSAYSSRTFHLCKAFQMSGYQTYVLADYSMSKEPSLCDEYVFDGIKYLIIGNTSKIYRYFKKTKTTINAINKIASSKQYGRIFVIISTADVSLYKKLKKTNDSRIVVVLESCEWFDKSSYVFRNLDPRYLTFQYAMKNYYIDGKNKIIAISEYLHDYFVRHRCECLRIPTIIDCSKIKIGDFKKGKTINFMFAGSLGGNKEVFKEFVRALINHKDKMVLHIYGGNSIDFKECLNDEKLYDKAKDCVIIHGRIPQELIYDEYQKADFSIIFRPKRRSSNAGFPTKMAESLACGTPVIANDTGDIGKYIINGQNGFIVDYNKESIDNLLQNISNNYDCKRLRLNARKTAEQYFDYRIYSAELDIFLKGN